jgi:hypothetical protein
LVEEELVGKYDYIRDDDKPIEDSVQEIIVVDTRGKAKISESASKFVSFSGERELPVGIVECLKVDEKGLEVLASVHQEPRDLDGENGLNTDHLKRKRTH